MVIAHEVRVEKVLPATTCPMLDCQAAATVPDPIPVAVNPTVLNIAPPVAITAGAAT